MADLLSKAERKAILAEAADSFIRWFDASNHLDGLRIRWTERRGDSVAYEVHHIDYGSVFGKVRRG